MRGTKVSKESSYSSKHVSKVSAKESNVGGVGKMTKFKSLDDIPDEIPDNFWGRTSDPAKDISNDSYYYVKESPHQVPPDDEDVYTIQNRLGALSIGNKATKAPPLPLDISRMNNAKLKSQQQQLDSPPPKPPSSKYFDYDETEEEEEEELVDQQTFCPTKPKGAVAFTGDTKHSKHGARDSGAGNDFAPPLPYETDKNASSTNQDGSIYFSKKPRPVNFK
jgi:hypothetical protein